MMGVVEVALFNAPLGVLEHLLQARAHRRRERGWAARRRLSSGFGIGRHAEV